MQSLVLLIQTSLIFYVYSLLANGLKSAGRSGTGGSLEAQELTVGVPWLAGLGE